MIKIKAKTKTNGNILIHANHKKGDELEACIIILHLIDMIKERNESLKTDKEVFDLLKIVRKESEILDGKSNSKNK